MEMDPQTPLSPESASVATATAAGVDGHTPLSGSDAAPSPCPIQPKPKDRFDPLMYPSLSPFARKPWVESDGRVSVRVSLDGLYSVRDGFTDLALMTMYDFFLDSWKVKAERLREMRAATVPVWLTTCLYPAHLPSASVCLPSSWQTLQPVQPPLQQFLHTPFGAFPPPSPVQALPMPAVA